MLLYEFPPKLDRKSRQLKAMHDLQEHKKMQKNMYKNLVLAAVIIAISFLVSVVLIKILLILIGVGNAAVALLLYQYTALSRDTKCYTKIFDDKIEHKQNSMISKKYTIAEIFYDDIEKSYQTNSGRLVFCLKKDFKSSFSIEEKGKIIKFIPQNNSFEMKFQDTKAKLFLIDNLYEKIKYPKKNYKVIDDEEDEDDKWDKLHKHGL